MKEASKKEMKNQYKNSWVRASADLQGAKNRFAFQCATNLCPETAMSPAWKRYGAAGFTFEILEEIKKKETQTPREFSEDISALLELWNEKQGERIRLRFLPVPRLWVCHAPENAALCIGFRRMLSPPRKVSVMSPSSKRRIRCFCGNRVNSLAPQATEAVLIRKRKSCAANEACGGSINSSEVSPPNHFVVFCRARGIS